MLSNKIKAGKTATISLNEIAADLIETDPFTSPFTKNLRTSYKFIPSTPHGLKSLKNF